MYIPRWKRLIILKRVIILMIIAAISVSVYIVYIKAHKPNHMVHSMDEDMMDYRTGGPLILYNIENGIIGFYLDDIPIQHIAYEEEIPNGVYRGELNEDSISVYDYDLEYFGEIPIRGSEVLLNFADPIIIVYDNE